MLHHASFNVHNPHAVAHVLAEMLGAVAIRAPNPPFPQGSWFVCYGDAGGSFLEVLPWGVVLDAEARFGVGTDEAMRPRTGAHVLVSTPHSVEKIQEVAGRQDWRTQIIDAGLFKVVKIWIENAVLVEFLPPEMTAAYLATFATAGIATLDAKLRSLEAALSSRS